MQDIEVTKKNFAFDLIMHVPFVVMLLEQIETYTGWSDGWMDC